jgi:hypothetical protein
MNDGETGGSQRCSRDDVMGNERGIQHTLPDLSTFVPTVRMQYAGKHKNPNYYVQYCSRVVNKYYVEVVHIN